MSVKLRIKNIKPHVEFSPTLNGKKQSVVFGIRIYDADELEAVREQFKDINSNELELASAKLQKHIENGDKASEEFYNERDNLQNQIDSLIRSQSKANLEFYKSHIAFIKNASLETEEDGVIKDIIIADSAKAVKIESLWDTPEECLAVLLDLYFLNIPIRDSLISKIVDTIYNINAEAKVKN